MSDRLLEGLAGVSFSHVTMKLLVPEVSETYVQSGPCLITHWGLSGPAVLRLSAFAARSLHQSHYQAALQVNWLGTATLAEALALLEATKREHARKQVRHAGPAALPRRFWEALVERVGIPAEQPYSATSRKQLQDLAEALTQCPLTITGKGVFKEEFVSAGGVAHEEIGFRTMASKRCPGVYFAGEVLDVDGITGGYNFQNAWTGAWLAGRAIAAACRAD